MKFCACAATLALLTACGGSGTDMTPAVPTRAQLGTDINAILGDLNRIDDLAPTSTANMPTSGSSTFNGGALVIASRGNVEYNLIGDSSLTVNFANDSMSGQASNFRGFTGSGTLIAAPGQLTYSGGQIGIGGDANAFSLSYNGALNAGGDRLAMRGNATGFFSGNRTAGQVRTRAVQGVSGTVGSITDNLPGGTPNMTATVNGAPAVADFTLYGEN